MYCDYWALSEPPFESDGSLDRWAATPEASDARLKLRYLHEHTKGGGVLVGASGVGKSMLLRRFAADIRQADGDDRRPIVHLVYPRLAPCELVAQLAVRLGADPATADSQTVGLDRLLDLLAERLRDAAAADRAAIIVVDDAHTIDEPDVWRTLRLLMNFRESAETAFTLVLAGQNELLGRLREHPELLARLPVRVALPTLMPASVGQYLRERLSSCGGDEAVFEPEAVATLADLSGGVPRRLNELADLTLLVGLADRLESIAAADVTAAREELHTLVG